MASSLRFLVRSAIANGWNTRTSIVATSAAWKSRTSFDVSRIPHRRYLHVTCPRAEASPESASSETSLPVQHDPDWRHPMWGFTREDFTCLISLQITRTTAREDIEALLVKAGFPDAQVTMAYEFDTGASEPFCFIKLADRDQASAATAALSRFTLLGCDVKLGAYETKRFSSKHQPSLFAGWKPSPSSDISSRVVRPVIKSPPDLLAPLMAKQVVVFQNLPAVYDRKDLRFEILKKFYKNFHQYDVVGITSIQWRSSPRHWHCKIQFGSPEEAQAARDSHLKARLFMGRVASAQFYKGLSSNLRELRTYGQSLPENTSESEASALLEQEYQNIVARERTVERRSKYPTPESAIGLKTTEPTSG